MSRGCQENAGHWHRGLLHGFLIMPGLRLFVCGASTLGRLGMLMQMSCLCIRDYFVNTHHSASFHLNFIRLLRDFHCPCNAHALLIQSILFKDSRTALDKNPSTSSCITSGMQISKTSGCQGARILPGDFYLPMRFLF